MRHQPIRLSHQVGGLSPDIEAQLKDAMSRAGVRPPDVIVADGKFHRFVCDGRHKGKPGWYIAHGEGVPSGSFGDWRREIKQSWRADIGRDLTPKEEEIHRARIKEMIR